MKPAPTWVVPIADGPTIVINIGAGGRIELGTDGPGGPLVVASPMESAQVAQALQDASREAAARRKR